MAYDFAKACGTSHEDIVLCIPPLERLDDDGAQVEVALNGSSGLRNGVYPNDSYYALQRERTLSNDDVALLYERALRQGAVFDQYDGDACVGHMISLRAPVSFTNFRVMPDFDEAVPGPALTHDIIDDQVSALQQGAQGRLAFQRAHDKHIVDTAQAGQLRYSAALGEVEQVDMFVVAHVDATTVELASSETWIDRSTPGVNAHVPAYVGADTAVATFGNSTDALTMLDIDQLCRVAGDDVIVDAEAMNMDGQPLDEHVLIIPVTANMRCDGALLQCDVASAVRRENPVDVADFHALHTAQYKGRIAAEKALGSHYFDDPYGQAFSMPRPRPTEQELRTSYVTYGGVSSDDMRAREASQSGNRASVAQRVSRYHASRGGATFAAQNEGWQVCE